MDRTDLLNAICGVNMWTRAYTVKDNAMSVCQQMEVGRGYGGFNNEWVWDRLALERHPTESLQELYSKIKY